MEQVRVLIIDDDQAGRAALASVLGSEGWQIEQVSHPQEGLDRLRLGGCHLLVANLNLTPLTGSFFDLLKELDQGPAPLRVLFLVPPDADLFVRQRLDALKLPYTAKPIHMHNFLEQVSDLLLAAGLIPEPLLGTQGPAATPRAAAARGDSAGSGQMFARRDPAFDYTDEELQQWEEEEQRKQKEKEEGEKPR